MLVPRLSDLRQEEESKQTHRRRRNDHCTVLQFWERWGPHVEISTLGAVLVGILGFTYAGFKFYYQTAKLPALVHEDHVHINLVDARQERFSRNIEIMMGQMKLQPMMKSDTEQQLERELEDERIANRP